MNKDFDQLSFAHGRQVPTEKIRNTGRRPVANRPEQGDAFHPGKIAFGNMPQDQESLFDKPPKPGDEQ